ncbi:MAG: Re/Si-specific NAD(P)(+) transhydrogenase subunit alpha [Candidatus Omnitrophota bacterium]
MTIVIAVPKEITALESRVAATPETVKKMVAMGLSVRVETQAGLSAMFRDTDYEKAGASIAPSKKQLYAGAKIVLKVQPPTQDPKTGEDENELIASDAILIGFFMARWNPAWVQKMNARGIPVFSIDGIPRIARAQKMDALSSQSNIAGYKAVLLAANRLHKMMPLFMTAAGTIMPARVFVLGAGVAGLQAIATAKRLGAVVEAFDTRPVVREQVESLGGKFVQFQIASGTQDAGGYARELSEQDHKKETELVAKHVSEADIVITTALIPGKPAPLLITEETVRRMKPGSVIVDLAAENGGNCALTEKGKEVEKHGVTILGTVNLPSLVASDAARLYAKNILNFLEEIVKDGKLKIDLQDEVIQGALVTDPARCAVSAGSAV